MAALRMMVLLGLLLLLLLLPTMMMERDYYFGWHFVRLQKRGLPQIDWLQTTESPELFDLSLFLLAWTVSE
jgi:hypothetical protein